jgi:hypothetical protein
VNTFAEARPLNVYEVALPARVIVQFVNEERRHRPGLLGPKGGSLDRLTTSVGRVASVPALGSGSRRQGATTPNHSAISSLPSQGGINQTPATRRTGGTTGNAKPCFRIDDGRIEGGSREFAVELFPKFRRSQLDSSRVAVHERFDSRSQERGRALSGSFVTESCIPD